MCIYRYRYRYISFNSCVGVYRRKEEWFRKCGEEKRKPSTSAALSTVEERTLRLSFREEFRWPKAVERTSREVEEAISSVQSLGCVQLCNPTDCSTPGFPVHLQLLEFTHTHDHQFGDAIQSSHPLLSPSPPTFNLSQHQGLFQWVSSLHQVARVLDLQLQHQSFQWIFRVVFL